MTEQNDKKVWFRAKRYGWGWGWGFPCAWQGWVVLAAYITLICAGAVVWSREEGGLWCWIGYLAALSALLVVICVIKGEKPRWRWGGE